MKVVFDTMCDLFKDIIPVRKVGQTHIWFTPWDYLIRWWGIEEAMIDMVDRPDLVHAAYERMVDAWMTELDQFEAQNLLSLDNANVDTRTKSQLNDFFAYPTTLFVDRNGIVQQIHEGFKGPGTGEEYQNEVSLYYDTVQKLLKAKAARR